MKKILVVDDEEEIRELIKGGLSKSNYAVLTAASGEEAINISKAEHPDLILLDIAMPGIDGYETCQRLKMDKETKDIAILFFTAKDLEPEGIIERYQELGASGYINKPSTFKDLLGKVKEVIG